MYLLFSFVALILVILWFCSRLLGWLICWVMENQGLGVLTIGRTDFFVFENMSLMLKGGVVLDVEKLWFSSSFISNEVRKPFVLCVSNVRVYLDEQSSSTMQESDEVLEEGEGEGELAGEGQEQFDPPEMNHEILTAHDTRGIMYFASSYLQYVGVSIKTIQVISVQNLSTEQCLIHMSVRQTNLDFNTQNTSQQISITNDNFTAKVLSKTSKEDVDRYVKDAGLSQEHPCLCEASLAFHITYCINATTFTPQVASLLIKKPQVNMKKNLLQLLYAVKKKKRKRVVNRKQSLLHRIQNVVPKIAKLHIDECNVSVQRDPANRNLSVLIGSIDSNIQQAWEEEGFSQTVIMLDMNGLIARSSQVNLVEIREYSLHFMIGDQNVGISSNLRTCFLGYHHEELQYWLAGLIGDSRHQAPVKQPQHKTSSTLPLHLLQDKTLTFSLDLSDCQTIVATAATQGVKFGVTSTKLTVTYKPEVLAGPPKSVLGSCESLRVKIETIGLFCKLTQGGPSTSDLSMKVHHHGTLVYVYFTLITAVKMLSSDPTLDVVLDGVQLETSPTVTATLTQLIRVVFTTAAAATQHRSSVAQRSSTSKDKPDLVADMYVNDADECIDNNAEDIDRHDAAAQHPTIIDLLQTAVMTININCVTAYLCNQLNVCTLLRVDAVNLAQRLKEMTFNVVGCKGVYMINEEKSIAIMRAAEIKQPTVVSIDWFDVTVSMVSKRCVIKLAEQIDIQWTPALHLSVFHAAKDLLDVMHAIQEPKSRDDEGDTQCAATTAQQPSLLMSLMVVVCLNGENRVKFQFSEQHSMTVVTTSLKLLHASDSITLTCANVLVMCDQHDVFTFKDISFVTDPQGLHIQSVRQAKSFKSILTQRTNRLWSFSCELVSIRFPYGYNFAACLEQALNMNKWRKVVHGVVKKKFTAYSPISADLAINIQAFTVQLCDDPFEVKLRDNYELLVDENTESTKRTSAMDKKMKELKKKHGLLNESKVSELYSSLRERNAHIYIQRSRQLYDNAPMRDKLMTITFHNMSVTCMADPALHGDDNVITHMKDIDSVAPFPESGSISFVTLWCRLVKVSLTSWVVQLRDFQQPIWEVVDLHLWGRLIGAEQRGSFRARRSSTISAGKPWSDVIVERNMPTLKFYHDFSCEMDSWTMAYGTCLEPTVAQCNLSMNLVNRPSVDPSKPLPFWDKQRLLLHGHLTAYSKQVHWLYHASLLNPYNTTEMLDWAWSELMLDWTSGKWVLKGDLDICVRTASKYDDCRLLSLPNLELRIGFNWVCNGNQHAHHSVMPCAPDKVPEYSHQEHPHDSYQAFRSQKLDLEMSFKTTTSTVNPDSQPACHFYNSTLRWLDKVKACMTRVTRPIRRGKLYNTKTPRKPQLTRHLRNAHLSLDIGSFAVHYWASFAKQHGSILYGKVFHVSTSALLSLVEPEGDPTLIRRKQTSWSVQRLLCELDRGSAYLCSANTTGHEEISLREPVKKSFFLSVEKLTYRRGGPPGSDQVTMDPFAEELPNHRVHIYGLKGVWSFVNRNVAFSLYDGYAHAQTLRRNLSADALKGYKVEDASAHTPAQGQRSKSMTSPTLLTPPSLVSTPSPLTKLQSGQAHNMLQKLIAEADSKYVAVSEEVCGGNVQLDQLHGVMACQKEDVAQRNLLVELEGSQVLLQGTETHGSVIASAGKASIISSEHQPIWQARHLKSKTSWTGVVDAMQYYATVDQDISDSTTSNTANSTANDTQSLCWLSRQHIEQSVGTPEGDLPTGISEMLASGKSVGSVVTDLVDTEDNPLDPTCSTVQLQRVSSRCKCQFFYVYYGEVDPDIFPHVPPPPKDESESLNEEESADAFTLLHHDLNVCTNSLQYAMILDIINNVLLFVEPKRKASRLCYICRQLTNYDILHFTVSKLIS